MLSSLDSNEFESRFVEERGDLLTLPRNRVTLWIVLIIGGDIGGGLDDGIKAVRQARRATSGRRPKFIQSVPRIAGPVGAVHEGRP